MSEKVFITLFNPVQAHQSITQTWMDYIKPFLVAGHRLTLEVKQQTRTPPQNSLMWQLLTDISKQVDWYGNKLTPEEWKTVLSASLNRQKVVPGIDGGFVVLGLRTSKMTIAQMTEMIELCYAFGTQQGVKFDESQESNCSIG